MPLELRGGFPVIENHTVDTTGGMYRFVATSNWLQISSDGALEIYTEESKFIDRVDFVPHGGPGGWYEGPADTDRVWLRAPTGTTDVTLMYYTRKG